MDEKEKAPRGRGEKLMSHIYVLRGLISYHERMLVPLEMLNLDCQKKGCPALAFQKDVYLEALKEALKLMEREAALPGSDETFTSSN